MRLLPLSKDLRDDLLKYREAQRAHIAEINARTKRGEQPIVMGGGLPRHNKRRRQPRIGLRAHQLVAQ